MEVGIWIIGIGIIILIFAKRIISKNDSSYESMSLKYKPLVKYFCSKYSNSSSIKKSTEQITIYGTSGRYKMKTLLKESLGSIQIYWTLESPSSEKHELKWHFNEYYGQDQILEEIDQDIKSIEQKIKQKESGQKR